MIHITSLDSILSGHPCFWEEICGLNHNMSQRFLLSEENWFECIPSSYKKQLKSSCKVSNTTSWPRIVLLGFLFTSSPNLTLLRCHPTLSAVVLILPGGIWCHGWVMWVMPYMFVDLRDSLLIPKLGLLGEICLGSVVSSLEVACSVGRWKTRRTKQKQKKTPTHKTNIDTVSATFLFHVLSNS